MEIISCAEAKRQGLNRYFTGKPCSKGHVDLRRVRDKQCMGCRRLEKKRARARGQGFVLDEHDRKCVVCSESKNVLSFQRRQCSSTVFPWCLDCAERDESLHKVSTLVSFHTGLAEMAATSMVYHTTARAKRRGLFCTLKPADLLPLPFRCPILGVQLDYTARMRRYSRHWDYDRVPGSGGDFSHSASVDRIDSELFYTPDNIVIISAKANTIKSNLSLREMKAIVRFYDDQEYEVPVV